MCVAFGFLLLTSVLTLQGYAQPYSESNPPRFSDGTTLNITIIPSHFFLWNVSANPGIPIGANEVSGYFNEMVGIKENNQ